MKNLQKLIHNSLQHKFFRYFIGGGIATLVDLTFLYVLVDIFHVYYLV
jgi:putative flippase GtrA